MKVLLFLILFIHISASAQDGGIRSLKTKSVKIIHSDLVGNNNVLIRLDNNGNEKKTFIDGKTIFLDADTIKSNVSSYRLQTLSGTNIIWNLANGKDATITLTGNTVITLTNATQGLSGTLWVTNPSTVYTITFAGYVNSIDPFIRLNSNIVITSGGSKSDDYTYKYNGTKLNWNGTLDRH